jgi:peptide chain release factor 1
VSEGGGGGGIGQIISGDIDGLHGGNGTLLGGGDTLLHTTHIGGESGLVTDGRGDTTKKSRHLGTGLGETENVVNEEQHILTLLVTEVLSDGKTSKSDTGTSTRGLVHLTEDKGDLGVTVKLNDGSLLHLVVQIVTLTGTLTDTSKDRETTVGLGDVVNQLLNEDSLSNTSTSKETNLSTTSVRSQQVDNLDTGNEDLSGGGLLGELRGVGVDGGVLGGLDGTTLVNGVTSDVHDTTEGTGTDGNHDGVAGIENLLTTDETFGTVHGNAADNVLTQMLGNLQHQLVSVVFGVEGIENRW